MNQVRLTAQAVECRPLRFTPAGVPVLELVLAHESEVVEAGKLRRVEMALAAVAVGELARTLERTALGRRMRFEGFLAPSRKGSTRLRLHIQQASAQADRDDPRPAGPAAPDNETD
ncbi:primosomal replication protein N [Pigmentiphaga soli]|uniref:Replication restart protein PriB n=1 Tax=Pigmentiphaga soli TaxID=1007095 RepID=A0ABP8H7X2_9BURK